MKRAPHDQMDEPNGTHPLGVLPCPLCGTTLVVSLLELDDEDAGTTGMLLLLDCPTDDYHGTLTQKDITNIIADEVIRRWR